MLLIHFQYLDQGEEGRFLECLRLILESVIEEEVDFAANYGLKQHPNLPVLV